MRTISRILALLILLGISLSTFSQRSFAGNDKRTHICVSRKKGGQFCMARDTAKKACAEEISKILKKENFTENDYVQHQIYALSDEQNSMKVLHTYRNDRRIIKMEVKTFADPNRKITQINAKVHPRLLTERSLLIIDIEKFRKLKYQDPQNKALTAIEKDLDKRIYEHGKKVESGSTQKDYTKQLLREFEKSKCNISYAVTSANPDPGEDEDNESISSTN